MKRKRSNDKRYDVAISFSSKDSKDKAIVEKIKLAIQECGLSVWSDENIGISEKDFQDRIIRVFKSSRMILFCLSETFNKSSWCNFELGIALTAETNANQNSDCMHIVAIQISGSSDVIDGAKLLNKRQILGYNDNPNEIATKLHSLLSGNTNIDGRSELETSYYGEKEEISSLLKYNSWLDSDRKEEIAKQRIDVIPELRKHRAKHKAKRIDILDEFQKLGDKNSPAWVRISHTDSDVGARLIIGFRHNQCLYRKRDSLGLGCLNCGYYYGTGFERSATTPELLRQLYEGLKYGYNKHKPFDVLEFLSDGSFLNDGEYNDKEKEKILEKVSKLPRIKRLLIETTPEHVTSQDREVETIIEKLREDQLLEVGIGLETKDDFIRSTCINKGFTLSVFEKAAEKLANVSKQYGGRCRLVAYILLKPAFLTEKETIEDCLSTLIYLSNLSNKLNLDIIPKLEPAVVSNGTVLSLLYKRGEYKPLSYWTVLEIITRASEIKECKQISKKIRVGAREDMDDVLKVSAVYSDDGRFDQLDFILYEAIQRYNATHDLDRIFRKLIKCSKKTKPIDRFDSSLSEWATDTLGGREESYALKKIILMKNKGKEAIAAHTENEKQEISFLKDTYWVLDLLEGYEQISDNFTKRLKNIGDAIVTVANKDQCKEAAEIIHEAYRHRSRDLISTRVHDIKNEDEGKYLRIFFDVTDFISDRTYSIWSEIISSK